MNTNKIISTVSSNNTLPTTAVGVGSTSASSSSNVNLGTANASSHRVGPRSHSSLVRNHDMHGLSTTSQAMTNTVMTPSPSASTTSSSSSSSSSVSTTQQQTGIRKSSKPPPHNHQQQPQTESKVFSFKKQFSSVVTSKTKPATSSTTTNKMNSSTNTTTLSMLKRTLSNSMLDLASTSANTNNKQINSFENDHQRLLRQNQPPPLYRTGSDCSIFNSTTVSFFFRLLLIKKNGDVKLSINM